jgi:hypothetical protein
MLYNGSSLRLAATACYSLEMTVTSASTYHSITHRTGKEYGKGKFVQETTRVVDEFRASFSMILYKLSFNVLPTFMCF